MSTQIIYNGVDITKDIDITACKLIDRNGGRQDCCNLAFANGGKIWNEWEVKKDDTVVVKKGHFSSGKMFVNSIESNAKNYSLILLPTPTTTKQRKSRIWRKVRLSEIISDVSKKIGFKTQFYGFKDYEYESLSQINETDIAFMCNMCRCEGYCVKIYDEKIIVYDVKALYAEDASGTIRPEDCSIYEFYNANIPLSSISVCYYNAKKRRFTEFTAKTDVIKGESKKTVVKVDNQAQAERFAKNYLQQNNNFVDCGTLSLKNADVFSTGSVIQLENFNDYSGKWYINESIFDTISNDCLFKINRIRS